MLPCPPHERRLSYISLTRAGDVFHVELAGLPGSGLRYGFRVAGDGGWAEGHRWEPERVLLDPYAPLVAGRRRFGVRDGVEQFQGKVRAGQREGLEALKAEARGGHAGASPGQGVGLHAEPG